jgi:hypothetical protein
VYMSFMSKEHILMFTSIGMLFSSLISWIEFLILYIYIYMEDLMFILVFL